MLPYFPQFPLQNLNTFTNKTNIVYSYADELSRFGEFSIKKLFELHELNYFPIWERREIGFFVDKEGNVQNFLKAILGYI